jgi:hypothetical protein
VSFGAGYDGEEVARVLSTLRLSRLLCLLFAKRAKPRAAFAGRCPRLQEHSIGRGASLDADTLALLHSNAATLQSLRLPASALTATLMHLAGLRRLRVLEIRGKVLLSMVKAVAGTVTSPFFALRDLSMRAHWPAIHNLLLQMLDTRLVRLNLQILDDNDVDLSCVTAFSILTRLRLYFVNNSEPRKSYIAVARGMSKLQSLSILSGAFGMEYDSRPDVTDQDLTSLVTRLKDLCYLHIRRCTNLTTDAFTVLAARCPL